MYKLLLISFSLLLSICASAQQKAAGDSVSFEKRESMTYAQALQERIVDTRLSLKYAVDNISKEIKNPIFKNIPQSKEILELQKYIDALAYAISQDLPMSLTITKVEEARLKLVPSFQLSKDYKNLTDALIKLKNKEPRLTHDQKKSVKLYQDVLYYEHEFYLDDEQHKTVSEYENVNEPEALPELVEAERQMRFTFTKKKKLNPQYPALDKALKSYNISKKIAFIDNTLRFDVYKYDTFLFKAQRKQKLLERSIEEILIYNKNEADLQTWGNALVKSLTSRDFNAYSALFKGEQEYKTVYRQIDSLSVQMGLYGFPASFDDVSPLKQDSLLKKQYADSIKVHMDEWPASWSAIINKERAFFKGFCDTLGGSTKAFISLKDAICVKAFTERDPEMEYTPAGPDYFNNSYHIYLVYQLTNGHYSYLKYNSSAKPGEYCFLFIIPHVYHELPESFSGKIGK